MLKKIVNRVVLALALLLPFAAIAHYFVFPQESNCILVRFSGLEKQGNLYYNKNTPTIDIDTLKTLIDVASTRVATFWGEKKGTPIYIYCNSDEEFKKYGNDRLDPATTQVKLGTYIVIRKDGIDLDVLAHEICHAELAERIGFFAWISKVPLWFNEGLAMQCDERPEFSEDSLKIKTNNLENINDLKTKMINGFHEGTNAQVHLNYMIAKYEVKNWYTSAKLKNFINALNEGKNFGNALGTGRLGLQPDQ